VIVRFHHYKDKVAIQRASATIKENISEYNLYISDDYPHEIQQRRKVMMPIFHAAKAAKPQSRVTLNAATLRIDGHTYTANSLYMLPPLLQPHNVATPQSGDIVAFFTKSSEFSNHHPCSFIVDDTSYNCGEQYIAAQKALLFNDKKSNMKIMSTSDPIKIENSMKAIAGFNKQRWQNKAPELMLKGLEAKFVQNPDLGDTLLDTGDKTIIEASPTDSFWGVSLGLRSTDLFQRDKWNGMNHMGECLMRVRSMLADLRAYIKSPIGVESMSSITFNSTRKDEDAAM
jgi:hypothetical protein